MVKKSSRLIAIFPARRPRRDLCHSLRGASDCEFAEWRSRSAEQWNDKRGFLPTPRRRQNCVHNYSILGEKPVGNFIVRIIRQWTGGAAGSVAGNLVYDAAKGKFVPANKFQVSTGQVWARAFVSTTSLEGETIIWYGVSGKPSWSTEYGLDSPLARKKLKKDYQYFDYTYEKMRWNADDEIYEKDTNFTNRCYYGSRRYPPDTINSRYNQGEYGAYYPEHDDYKKGKAGYLIVWGTTQKVDLKHAFKTNIGVPIDNKLKNKAPKHKKDKLNPEVFVWLSDMRYMKKNGTIGWTYKARTEAVEIDDIELSAIVADSVDLGDRYIPLNTRLESADYEKNESRIYWKKEGIVVDARREHYIRSSRATNNGLELTNGESQ